MIICRLDLDIHEGGMQIPHMLWVYILDHGFKMAAVELSVFHSLMFVSDGMVELHL